MPLEYNRDPILASADQGLKIWKRQGIQGYAGGLYPGGDIDVAQVIAQARRELEQFKLTQQPQPEQQYQHTDGYIPTFMGDTV